MKERNENNIAGGVQVSKATGLFITALQDLGKAYDSIYYAIEEYSGKDSVDANMEKDFTPLYDELRHQVEAWMVASITNNICDSQDRAITTI